MVNQEGNRMNRQPVKYADNQEDKYKAKKQLIDKSRASTSDVTKALDKIIEAHRPALKELANR